MNTKHEILLELAKTGAIQQRLYRLSRKFRLSGTKFTDPSIEKAIEALQQKMGEKDEELSTRFGELFPQDVFNHTFTGDVYGSSYNGSNYNFSEEIMGELKTDGESDTSENYVGIEDDPESGGFYFYTNNKGAEVFLAHMKEFHPDVRFRHDVNSYADTSPNGLNTWSDAKAFIEKHDPEWEVTETLDLEIDICFHDIDMALAKVEEKRAELQQLRELRKRLDRVKAVSQSTCAE